MSAPNRVTGPGQDLSGGLARWRAARAVRQAFGPRNSIGT
jgi:hypothetical protein